MLALFFIVFLSPVSAGHLTCSPADIICPGSPVTCECHNARGHLRWIITSSAGTELLNKTYHYEDSKGVSTSDNNFTVVLSDKKRKSIQGTYNTYMLFSKVNFTFSKDVNVTCEDTTTKFQTIIYTSKKLALACMCNNKLSVF